MLLGALIAVVGSVQTSYFLLARAMMLHAAPEELRGRVISLLSLDRAFMTAGAAFAGFLAYAIGVQPAQIIYGLVCTAGGLAMFIFAREFRQARTVAAPESPTEPPPTTAPAAAERPTAERPARTAGVR